MNDRRIPESWFRALPMATTMAYVTENSSARRALPLLEGERELGWFVLPHFQRPPVWTVAQKASFVESCWLGLPVGAFIFNQVGFHSPYENWLLDGQQRVTAVLEYVADEFEVFGHKFSELTDVDLRVWSMSVSFPCMRTNIRNEDQLREVYDRLAYGGTPHEPR